MLEKISGDGRVETMCSTISVFLMAFVIFYMSYSNRFFLRRRTKELGIYALLGYRKSTILSLLTVENLLSCFGAFVTGILLGGLFHKGIVFGITELLDLTVNNSEIPFFNLNAMIKTACFVFAIIIILSLSNSKFLFKSSLMDLVRFEKSAEKQTKFHAVPSITGFVSVILGYCIALDILRGEKSVWFSAGFYAVGMLLLHLSFWDSAFYRIFSPLCGTDWQEKQEEILYGNKNHYFTGFYIPDALQFKNADHAHITVSRNSDCFKCYGSHPVLSDCSNIPHCAVRNRMPY